MVDRLSRWLLTERKTSILYALAAAAGLAMAWYLMGWDGIHGTSRYWETTHNDSLQSIAALRYYVGEPWSWPLLEVTSFGVPEGTNLILSDSIPLLAVPARLLRGVLPASFHYFGYWMAFCFVMQAVAFVALLVEFRFSNYLALIVGSIIGLSQTALMSRFFHVALMAQFVILLIVILGIRLERGERPLRALILMAVLLGSTFFVHIYLYAMGAVLAVAFVVQAGLVGRLAWKRVVRWIGGLGFATIGLVIINGLEAAAFASGGGLGFYSMNLMGPLVRDLDATGGQYEGFSYVGAGVIAAGVAVAILARRELAAALHRFWVPALAACLMAVYALSPTVWIGEWIRIDIPWFGPLEWLGERFRSTGRFVWPLVYVSLAATLYAVVRHFNGRVAGWFLLAAVIVQGVDAAAAVSNLSQVLRSAENQYLAAEAWTEVISNHDLVRIVPQECVDGLGIVGLANREVQRLAGLTGTPITAAAVARPSSGCARNAYEQPVVTGELRIAWNAVYPDYRIDGAECVSFDLGIACSAGDGDPSLDLLQPLTRTGG